MTDSEQPRPRPGDGRPPRRDRRRSAGGGKGGGPRKGPSSSIEAADVAWEDLARILKHPRPSELLYELKDSGRLREVLPELHDLVGVEQPAKSHGCDAFDHTLKVVDAARADQALRGAGDPELMLAALFHDVGKARTKAVDPETGRITFHAHQFVGERMTRKRLRGLARAAERAGAERGSPPGIDPDRVASLVRHHMFDLDVNLSEKAIRRFTRKLGGEEMTEKLLDLRIADKRGGARPDRIGAILAFRKRVRRELHRREPFGIRNLAIGGHDLMEHGIPEGPYLGFVLHRLLALVQENRSLNDRDTLLALVT